MEWTYVCQNSYVYTANKPLVSTPIKLPYILQIDVKEATRYTASK